MEQKEGFLDIAILVPLRRISSFVFGLWKTLHPRGLLSARVKSSIVSESMESSSKSKDRCWIQCSNSLPEQAGFASLYARYKQYQPFHFTVVHLLDPKSVCTFIDFYITCLWI